MTSASRSLLRRKLATEVDRRTTLTAELKEATGKLEAAARRRTEQGDARGGAERGDGGAGGG